MTALPTIATLRRHALPCAAFDRLVALPPPRPRLAARWTLGEHGRPVCGWTVEPAPSPPEAARPG